MAQQPPPTEHDQGRAMRNRVRDRFHTSFRLDMARRKNGQMANSVIGLHFARSMTVYSVSMKAAARNSSITDVL